MSEDGSSCIELLCSFIEKVVVVVKEVPSFIEGQDNFAFDLVITGMSG